MKIKNKHFFLKFSIPFVLSYWLFDSVIHYFVYGELEFEIIPSDGNELWMRCMILFLLILFGMFADFHIKKLNKKSNEKYDVYVSMLKATKHILNNFLQKMFIFQVEAEKSKDFDKKILTEYDQMIDATTNQIKNLEGILEPNKDIIEERYKPK